MSVTSPSVGPAKRSAQPIRVMVVDDSLVIRGLITRVLKENPAIDVVASIPNGERAVERVRQGGIDVVVLDIEMPVMDGLTALPLIIKEDPTIVVIMASTLTTRNADYSLRALQAGATDYVPKPTTNKELFSAEDFKRELTDKVLTLGRHRRGSTAKPVAKQAEGAVSRLSPSSPIQLRKPSPIVPRVLAIASSTGGPNALHETLANIGRDVKVPIVITQHMPPTFTKILADNLMKETGIACEEPVNGTVIKPGHAYVAPGDFHMTFMMKDASVAVNLVKSPPENFCRPAADPMLRSLVKIYGPKILTVVLTGMGADGLQGCRAVVEAGGSVIAQDEASSVVWGMPGAVAKDGLCSAVEPVSKIGSVVKSRLGAS